MKYWFYYDENNEIKEIKSIEDFPDGTFGYVYKITNITNGKFYIGKKYLRHTQKKKLTLTEKAENKKKNIWKDFKQVVKESDWQLYYGSNKVLKEDIQKLGKDSFDREILKFCKGKKELTFFETSYQFKYDVLHIDCYNDNIMGRHFREDFAE